MASETSTKENNKIDIPRLQIGFKSPTQEYLTKLLAEVSEKSPRCKVTVNTMPHSDFLFRMSCRKYRLWSKGLFELWQPWQNLISSSMILLNAIRICCKAWRFYRSLVFMILIGSCFLCRGNRQRPFFVVCWGNPRNPWSGVRTWTMENAAETQGKPS